LSAEALKSIEQEEKELSGDLPLTQEELDNLTSSPDDKTPRLDNRPASKD